MAELQKYRRRARTRAFLARQARREHREKWDKIKSEQQAAERDEPQTP